MHTKVDRLDAIVDFWLSYIAERDEWLRSEIKRSSYVDYTNTEMPGRRVVRLKAVLSLLTKPDKQN